MINERPRITGNQIRPRKKYERLVGVLQFLGATHFYHEKSRFRKFLVGPFIIFHGTEMVCGRDKKKSPTLVRDIWFPKERGCYPSITLYFVPFKVIFLMLSIVKLCTWCLLSWGCLLVSDFLTSKDLNISRSMFLPSNSYSVE